MSVKYFYPDNEPTVVVESPEDLREILDILHTQAIDNLGEDSDEAQYLVCWMEELDGVTSNWYQNFQAVEKQRDSAHNRLKWCVRVVVFKSIIDVIICLFATGVIK